MKPEDSFPGKKNRIVALLPFCKDKASLCLDNILSRKQQNLALLPLCKDMLMLYKPPPNSQESGTVYDHFCAGENVEEASKMLQRLWDVGLSRILDYGLEDASDNHGCDRNLEEFLNTINIASLLPPSSEDYPKLSAAVAGARKFDVYMGIDVFGRGTYGGGQWNVGTPICIPSKDFIDIRRVASIEINHKQVDVAKKGQKVAIKIVGSNFEEQQKMFRRHFEIDDELVSHISRRSIDLLKENYRVT